MEEMQVKGAFSYSGQRCTAVKVLPLSRPPARPPDPFVPSLPLFFSLCIPPLSCLALTSRRPPHLPPCTSPPSHPASLLQGLFG